MYLCIYTFIYLFPQIISFFFYFLIYLYFRYNEVPMRYGYLFVLKFDFLSRENFYQIEITSRPSFETHKKFHFIVSSVLFKITARNSRFQEFSVLLKIQSLNVTTNFATKGVETRLWVARKLENAMDESSEIVSRPSFDI